MIILPESISDTLFIWEKNRVKKWISLIVSKLFKIWEAKKELSLWNKIKYLNQNIFRIRCCKPLIFQTQITLSNRNHSLKYLRYVTFGSKDIVIRKQSLWQRLNSFVFLFIPFIKNNILLVMFLKFLIVIISVSRLVFLKIT